MIRDIYNAENIQEVSDNLDGILQKGIYVFLEHGKKYNMSDISEQFIAKNTCMIYQDKADLIITDTERVPQIELFSKYSKPNSANQMIFGNVNGIYTVVSNLYTETTLEKFLKEKTPDKNKSKIDNFYSKGFLRERFEKDILKALKGDKKENFIEIKDDISKEQFNEYLSDYLSEYISPYYKYIDQTEEDALLTGQSLLENYDFLVELWKEIVIQNAKLKKSRIFFIFKEFTEQHLFESFLNNATKYFGNTNKVFVNGEGYFPTFLSSIYNVKKPMTYFNKEDSFFLTGNEYFKFSEIKKHYDFMKYIEFMGTKHGSGNTFSIYIKDNKIISKPVVGCVENKFKNEKSTIQLVSERTVTQENKGDRLLDINFEHRNIHKDEDTGNYSSHLITHNIPNVPYLESLIFYGDFDNNIKSNMIYTGKYNGDFNDNSLVRNSLYQGKSFTKQKMAEKMVQELKDYNEYRTNSLNYTIDTLSKLVLYSSKFGSMPLSYSKLIYENSYRFWKTMRKEFLNDLSIDRNQEKIDTIYQEFSINKEISSDEEYVFLSLQLVMYLLGLKTNKPLDNEIQPYLRTTSSKQLLHKVEQLVNKSDYLLRDEKHKLKTNYVSNLKENNNLKHVSKSKLDSYEHKTRVERLLDRLSEYQPKKSNISTLYDFKLLGIFTDNVFYKKTMEKKEEE